MKTNLSLIASIALVGALHAQTAGSSGLRTAQPPAFKTLDPASYDRIATPLTTIYIEALRLHPELLDKYLTTFALLNNCVSSDIDVNRKATASVKAAMQNEFDRPAIRAFYTAHAKEIIAGLPKKTVIMTTGGPNFGEYDVVNRVFALQLDKTQFTKGKGYSAAPDLTVSALRIDTNKFGGVVSALGCALDETPPMLGVQFSPITFTTIPVSEENARKYVEKHPNERLRKSGWVYEMEIQRLDLPAGGSGPLDIQGVVKKITVLGLSDGTKTFGGLNVSASGPAATWHEDPPLVLAVLDPQTLSAPKKPSR